MNTPISIGIATASALPSAAAVGSAIAAAPASSTFLAQHGDIVSISASLAVGIIGFFLHRSLKQNDEQHQAIFSKMEKTEDRHMNELKELWKAQDRTDRALNILLGEHVALHGPRPNRVGDPPLAHGIDSNGQGGD